MPLILYNVPGRTVADLANETALRLAQVPGIVGIKDATADLGRGSELLRALGAGRTQDFAVYSGDDLTALPLMLMGGHGVISVTANVAPKLMAQMCAAALRGDIAAARACNDRLLPLHRKLFVEANPIPVKWALARNGSHRQRAATSARRRCRRNITRRCAPRCATRVVSPQPEGATHETIRTVHAACSACAVRRSRWRARRSPAANPRRSLGKKIDYNSASARARARTPARSRRTAVRRPLQRRDGLGPRRARRDQAKGGDQIAANATADAKIVKSGNERWLVVKATPEQAWNVDAPVLARQRLRARGREARRPA